MGILIEKPGVFNHMTAIENLKYFSSLFGITSCDFQSILEMVGLQNLEKESKTIFFRYETTIRNRNFTI